jgi:PAS domain S-box-containing protein
MNTGLTALRVVNHMHAMIAHWNNEERCTFSNVASQRWFGKTPDEMRGISLHELLGPALYEVKRPFIQGALRGEEQIFERNLPHLSGTTRRVLSTYTPCVEENEVLGFTMHVTALPEHHLHVPALLPICASCKSIQSASGEWHAFEDYILHHSPFSFTHGLCPQCIPLYFPDAEVDSP